MTLLPLVGADARGLRAHSAEAHGHKRTLHVANLKDAARDPFEDSKDTEAVAA